tara:strand:- start:1904 stop:2641 length:738 start_codon:yes stop_codon:yes gene_type:complete
MKRNYILALITILTLNSCGKSKEEVALEKVKIELEKTKLELDKKIMDEENLKVLKIHEQKSNVGKRKKITELNLQLQKFTEAIKKAQENIKKIEQYQIGRLKATKEKQLTEAYKQLREIRDYGEKLKNEIAQMEYTKTFDFQKNPVNLMIYIFESAKKGDFSNFRHLCDPYGEYDRGINRICNIEILPEKMKQEFKISFENGRIIGEAKIEGDIAKVEFAYGRSTNKLEEMALIKRNGLWYLAGF